MNIKQIRYFAAVVDHGSLSAASKDLRITVQAISKAVADLERELGCDLFVRVSRGMRPTPFALSFHEKARRVLADFEHLEAFSACDGDPVGKLGRLRLALNTPPFVGNEIVRENTAALIGGKLGIECSMMLATGPKGLEGLRAGEFDALVAVGAYDHPEVECRVVGTVPAAVMMRRGHPLAGRSAVELEDLVPYPVAVSSWHDQANDTVFGAYRDKGKRLGLALVDPSLSDVGHHFDKGGVVFTTGIPALEKIHPAVAVRVLGPKDAMAVPICLVYMKECDPLLPAVVEKVLAEGLPFVGCGASFGG